MSRSAKTALWVAWSVVWAVVWFILGFRTLGVTWTLTVLSLGAACIPVQAVGAAMPPVSLRRFHVGSAAPAQKVESFPR